MLGLEHEIVCDRALLVRWCPWPTTSHRRQPRVMLDVLEDVGAPTLHDRQLQALIGDYRLINARPKQQRIKGRSPLSTTGEPRNIVVSIAWMCGEDAPIEE